MPTFLPAFVSTSQILDGAVTNAKIATNAAIAFSKLAALDDGKILIGNGSNVAVKNAVTGDVTISNTGVTAIGAGKVTEAMQLLADNTTNNASTSAHGYLKKLDNVATNFMNGQGDWVAVSASGDFVKVGSTTGTTASTSEVDLAQISISASSFAARDILYAHAVGYNVSSTQIFKFRLYDGTNTVTTAGITSATNGVLMTETFVWQDINSGGGADQQLGYIDRGLSNATWTVTQSIAAFITNFLAAALTATIRGNAISSGTASCTFKIYRLKQ